MFKLLALLVTLPLTDSPRPALVDVAKRLESLTNEADLPDFADNLTRFFPDVDLKAGKHAPHREGTTALWLLAAPNANKAEVRLSEGAPIRLKPLGARDLFAATSELPNFTELDYQYLVDGKELGGGHLRVEHFPLGPDSSPQDGVPKGKLTSMPDWKSDVFLGTVRKWWIYTPANVTPDEELSVMVFQDGEWYATGEGNACIVFDNLIHQGKIPRLVGVFINPGYYPGTGDQKEQSHRSDEYDTCTPAYAEFLEKEILREVAKSYKLKSGAMDHAICGISSGGSCAFTAAWHRPDLFGRVLSHVGSFCDFRPIEKYPTADGSVGINPQDPATCKTAHEYPFLIRKTRPTKPLRVYLQAGSHDLDNPLGHWPLANQQMAAALAFSGYTHKFVYGEGFHSKAHGIALLPESLIWLWRDD